MPFGISLCFALQATFFVSFLLSGTVCYTIDGFCVGSTLYDASGITMQLKYEDIQHMVSTEWLKNEELCCVPDSPYTLTRGEDCKEIIIKNVGNYSLCIEEVTGAFYALSSEESVTIADSELQMITINHRPVQMANVYLHAPVEAGENKVYEHSTSMTHLKYFFIFIVLTVSSTSLIKPKLLLLLKASRTVNTVFLAVILFEVLIFLSIVSVGLQAYKGRISFFAILLLLVVKYLLSHAALTCVSCATDVAFAKRQYLQRYLNINTLLIFLSLASVVAGSEPKNSCLMQYDLGVELTIPKCEHRLLDAVQAIAIVNDELLIQNKDQNGSECLIPVSIKKPGLLKYYKEIGQYDRYSIDKCLEHNTAQVVDLSHWIIYRVLSMSGCINHSDQPSIPYCLNECISCFCSYPCLYADCQPCFVIEVLHVSDLQLPSASQIGIFTNRIVNYPQTQAFQVKEAIIRHAKRDANMRFKGIVRRQNAKHRASGQTACYMSMMPEIKKSVLTLRPKELIEKIAGIILTSFALIMIYDLVILVPRSAYVFLIVSLLLLVRAVHGVNLDCNLEGIPDECLAELQSGSINLTMTKNKCLTNVFLTDVSGFDVQFHLTFTTSNFTLYPAVNVAESTDINGIGPHFYTTNCQNRTFSGDEPNHTMSKVCAHHTMDLLRMQSTFGNELTYNIIPNSTDDYLMNQNNYTAWKVESCATGRKQTLCTSLPVESTGFSMKTNSEYELRVLVKACIDKALIMSHVELFSFPRPKYAEMHADLVPASKESNIYRKLKTGGVSYEQTMMGEDLKNEGICSYTRYYTNDGAYSLPFQTVESTCTDVKKQESIINDHFENIGYYLKNCTSTGGKGMICDAIVEIKGEIMGEDFGPDTELTPFVDSEQFFALAHYEACTQSGHACNKTSQQYKGYEEYLAKISCNATTSEIEQRVCVKALLQTFYNVRQKQPVGFTTSKNASTIWDNLSWSLVGPYKWPVFSKLKSVKMPAPGMAYGEIDDLDIESMHSGSSSGEPYCINRLSVDYWYPDDKDENGNTEYLLGSDRSPDNYCSVKRKRGHDYYYTFDGIRVGSATGDRPVGSALMSLLSSYDADIALRSNGSVVGYLPIVYKDVTKGLYRGVSFYYNRLIHRGQSIRKEGLAMKFEFKPYGHVTIVGIAPHTLSFRCNGPVPNQRRLSVIGDYYGASDDECLNNGITKYPTRVLLNKADKYAEEMIASANNGSSELVTNLKGAKLADFLNNQSANLFVHADNLVICRGSRGTYLEQVSMVLSTEEACGSGLHQIYINLNKSTTVKDLKFNNETPVCAFSVEHDLVSCLLGKFLFVDNQVAISLKIDKLDARLVLEACHCANKKELVQPGMLELIKLSAAKKLLVSILADGKENEQGDVIQHLRKLIEKLEATEAPGTSTVTVTEVPTVSTTSSFLTTVTESSTTIAPSTVTTSTPPIVTLTTETSSTGKVTISTVLSTETTISSVITTTRPFPTLIPVLTTTNQPIVSTTTGLTITGSTASEQSSSTTSEYASSTQKAVAHEPILVTDHLKDPELPLKKNYKLWQHNVQLGTSYKNSVNGVLVLIFLIVTVSFSL